MTPREILLIPLPGNDAYVATVGEYLQALLRTLWAEREGFSGKRPFGNSGWEHDLYIPLIAAGVVTGGSLGTDGYVNDMGNADQVVFDAIDALFLREVLGAESGVRASALREAVMAAHRMPDIVTWFNSNQEADAYCAGRHEARDAVSALLAVSRKE